MTLLNLPLTYRNPFRSYFSSLTENHARHSKSSRCACENRRDETSLRTSHCRLRGGSRHDNKSTRPDKLRRRRFPEWLGCERWSCPRVATGGTRRPSPATAAALLASTASTRRLHPADFVPGSGAFPEHQGGHQGQSCLQGTERRPMLQGASHTTK